MTLISCQHSHFHAAINYDLYILHAGVAQINIAVKTAGYVDEDTFNDFKKYVINTLNEGVGQNTKDLKFDVWTPAYTEDTNPSGGRVWSKKVDDTGEVARNGFCPGGNPFPRVWTGKLSAKWCSQRQNRSPDAAGGLRSRLWARNS